jgi:3-phosphoshikimate 1-carboxyvinyltransferase
MEKFYLPGGQSYKSFDETIPGDWESACFPLVAAAITNSDITVYGVDINDYQGDKAIINILRDMGANIEVKDEGRNGIIVKGGKDLQGIEIDCSDLPDIIPIAAVLGCRAKGKTVLTNLGASRLKETDRVRSITEELIKMGAKIEESENSLTLYESDLRGTLIDGRHDHRIVMATTVAGFIAKDSALINNAEYVKISFPNFFEIMSQLGSNIERLENI